MSISQIEESVKKLVQNLNIKNNFSQHEQQDSFIYDLLLAYEHRKQSVSRLRTGERNLTTKNSLPCHDNVIWKRHVYFKHIREENLHSVIDMMRKENLVSSNRIRFIIVTNFDQLLAVDTKTQDSLDISLSELPAKFDFFLPWAGMEKAVYQGENPADVKAAEKMAKLFDLIKDDNFYESNKDDTEALHGLNVFLTRLLFCFFAEDTEIFKSNQFSNAIQSHTKDDGSDLSYYLNRLFLVLNTADSDRAQLPNAPLPEYLDNFPYVNGGLFADDIPSPTFSVKSRRILIECGSQLNWSDINPDIFGSMIQAVVHPDQRGGMGMHYTSVTNIMKVIEPLFLNDLYEELEKSENSVMKLQKLQQRLGEIKIFDPACGSGNFLVIAYKELRKLEMEVLKRLQEIELEKTGQISQPFSVIKLSQFYGIELDDFAHEVAILSLWLTEHQMNVEFKVEFGEALPSLPLKKSGKIKCANSALIDWTSVCDRGGEIFIIGNPPYVGFQNQNADQKKEIEYVFNNFSNYKRIDYIGIWLVKAAEFVKGINGAFSFVSTNSICQGEQVRIIWPFIYECNLDLMFAYQPFDWSNNAKGKAKVTCIIIGLKNKSSINYRHIYSNGHVSNVKNISPYLLDSDSVIVEPRNKTLSRIPKMSIGNVPLDGNNFILSHSEKEEIITHYPKSKSFIRRYMGASDFLKGNKRYCIWVTDETKEAAEEIDPILERMKKCKVFRENGGIVARQHANVSHRFRTQPHKDGNSIIFPKTSSSRRKYIPTGFLNSETIVSEKALVSYGAEPYLFGILSSRMHVLWLSITSSRMRNDFQYSVQLSYNTFPIPDLSNRKIDEITNNVFEIISIRERYSEQTLANLYDPEKMPIDLELAHKALDVTVESCYSKKELKSDEERLAVLFSLYQEMKGSENA